MSIDFEYHFTTGFTCLIATTFYSDCEAYQFFEYCMDLSQSKVRKVHVRNSFAIDQNTKVVLSQQETENIVRINAQTRYEESTKTLVQTSHDEHLINYNAEACFEILKNLTTMHFE